MDICLQPWPGILYTVTAFSEYAMHTHIVTYINLNKVYTYKQRISSFLTLPFRLLSLLRCFFRMNCTVQLVAVRSDWGKNVRDVEVC